MIKNHSNYLESECRATRKIDKSPNPKFMLEYIKRFGDAVFDVCEDCYGTYKKPRFTSNECDSEVAEPSPASSLNASNRRR
jgi:hypothetical protein